MTRQLFVLPVLALVLAACGGGSDESAPPSAPAGSSDGPSTAATSPTDEPTTGPVTEASADLLGGATTFVAGGAGAVDLTVAVDGRECRLADVLPLTCRGASGTGGDFVVTVEGVADAPGDFNVVVRCGLSPAAPAASASGAFQPVSTDLGLMPYGDVIGLTLIGPDSAEAALVYQPADAECPVVWSLGAVARTSIFTGGTDALNGSEAPIRFVDATGTDACAVSDGRGGITVGAPSGDACR